MDSLFTAIFIGAGVVFMALGIPLLRGRVSPNTTYGFRTAKTLSDPQVWYAVNRVCGTDLVLAGVVVILMSLALLASQEVIASALMPGIMATVVLLCLFGTFVHCRRVLRRM